MLRFRTSLVFLILLFLQSLPIAQVQAQSISNVNGTVTDGNTLTIVGTNFGSKPIAEPVVFERFDSGTAGNQVAQAPSWDAISGSATYSGESFHSAPLAMKVSWADTYNSSVRRHADFSKGVYLDFWYRHIQEPPPYTRVHKMFLVYGNGPNEMPQLHYGTAECTRTAPFRLGAYNGSGGGSAGVYLGLLEYTGPNMHHVQIYAKPSTTAAGVSDNSGVYWSALDGRIRGEESANTVANGIGVWNHIRLGYFHAHDGLPNLCDPSPGAAYAYWDDIYLDTTPARVEIGNASSYEACTHREIQIPSSWGPQQITIRANLGSLNLNSPLYLFVLDQNNQSSAGFQLTDISGDNLAPSEPMNLKKK